MAWRTTEAAVAASLEMDSENPLPLGPFIIQANVLVNRLARKDLHALLETEDLAQIELFLACHFYSLRDPRYASKSTGGASGSFQSQAGAGVSGNDFWVQACQLDETGFLAGLSRTRHAIGGFWGGKVDDDDAGT
jgi:hypothetical protein